MKKASDEDARARLNRVMTEKQLMQSIIEMGDLLGWRSYHTFDSRRSTAGFPDLVMVRKGRLIMAEVKTATARATAAQRDWLDDLAWVAWRTDNIVSCHIWRPQHWTDGTIEAVLKGSTDVLQDPRDTVPTA